MITGMRLRELAALVGLGLAAAAPVSPRASASVSIEISWEALLHSSSAAVVATSVETRPVWEDGRIYTYTRVHVDRFVAGDLPDGGEAWVRTMGGVVGKVGQIVEGEAVLSIGETGLLFLHPGPPGAYVVTARGQGQFPLVHAADPKARPHLIRSNAAGGLLPPSTASASPFAADVVHGRGVDEVARDVTAAWDRAHAPHAP